MIDKLKTFVNKHKQEFDTAEPSQDLWKKIDAQMEGKSSSTISSKWMSKFKYFGLSASVLIIAVYFISQKLNNSSSNELAQNTKDSALNNSGEWVKTKQNNTSVNEAGNNIPNSSIEKNESENKGSSVTAEEIVNLMNGKDTKETKDTMKQSPALEVGIDHSLLKEADKPNTNTISEKKEIVSVPKKKNEKVMVPAEPEKINSYSFTLYNDYSLCSVIRAYKFSGQVSMDQSSNYQNHRTLKTISCSKLENIPNIKAVWLKGKTSKKMTISIKEGFKNILLLKSDGREIAPEAISHYYPGLGVISGYSGKFFEMTFKDKVELILFFKDAEEGDKISIDGIIEAVVKSTP